MKIFPGVLLALLLASAFGCKQVDELDGADIVSGDAEFAIPLFKARTSIQDLLENFDDYTYVEIDSEGVIHLRYIGEVLSQTASDFFKETKEKLPPIFPIDSTYYTLPLSTPDQLEVDYARYSAGTINVGIFSTYEGTIDFTMTVIETQKNGQPLTFHRQVASPIGIVLGGVNIPYIDTSLAVPVEGYELFPTNGQMHVQYTAITDQGDTLDLGPGNVWLAFKDIDFSYIEGYLGKFTHKGIRDSIAIEFFENWIQGDVFFEKPIIKIHINNSFGVPSRSSIDVFDIVTADNQRIPLQSTFITETGIDFAYPTLSEVGQTKSMTFVFDANNSNIEDVLGSKPVAIDYKVDAVMNPDSLSDERGFITDSSYYRIQVEVDLPLHGKAAGFGVVDDFDVDFSDYNDLKEMEFKMVADNKMPLAIEGQAYFMDESGTVLDSLFEMVTTLVEAAPVNGQGIVTGPVRKATYSTFDAVRFDHIRKAKKLSLHAFFSTSNNGQQSVKAFSDQDVEIRMGMKVKL